MILYIFIHIYFIFIYSYIFQNSYGRDTYDRKPIENVEQITLRELYELTLSRIEARKSNVYYSNQAPKNNYPDFTDYLNNDEMTEESKMSIISMAEQEKINNMEVDELENRTKNTQKIKLNFDKANTITDDTVNTGEKEEEEKEKVEKSETNNIPYPNNHFNTINGDEESDFVNFSDGENEPVIEIPITENSVNSTESNETLVNDPELLERRSNPIPHMQKPIPRIPDIDNYSDVAYEMKISPPASGHDETFGMTQGQDSMNNISLPQNHDESNTLNNASPPKVRELYRPNDENQRNNNLPKTLVCPRRIDSINRGIIKSDISSPLDLAHYKPPIKSLAEINDPDYEKNVGNEPIPYGSNVVYEETDITSPNLEEAIPVYNRPMMNYRDNLINMTYNHNYNMYNNHNNNFNNNYNNNYNVNYNSQNSSQPDYSYNMDYDNSENEKKKEKKGNRKSLSIFNILKKSKSNESMKKSNEYTKVKGHKSMYAKSPSKTNGEPENFDNKNISTSSPQFRHSLNILPYNGNFFFFFFFKKKF